MHRLQTMANRILLLLTVLWLTGSGVMAGDSRKWDSLYDDGLHDPENPGIKDLQQPGEALAVLPPDTAGNKVLWVKALRDGLIKPRTNILPETKIQILDMDIVYGKTGDNFYVRFPHKAHTEWLDCSNCHDRIFKQKYGSTPFTMMSILEGKFCGQCHGAVSFPLSECTRCHSVNPEAFRGQLGVQK